MAINVGDSINRIIAKEPPIFWIAGAGTLGVITILAIRSRMSSGNSTKSSLDALTAEIQKLEQIDQNEIEYLQALGISNPWMPGTNSQNQMTNYTYTSTSPYNSGIGGGYGSDEYAVYPQVAYAGTGMGSGGDYGAGSGAGMLDTIQPMPPNPAPNPGSNPGSMPKMPPSPVPNPDGIPSAPGGPLSPPVNPLPDTSTSQAATNAAKNVGAPLIPGAVLGMGLWNDDGSYHYINSSDIWGDMSSGHGSGHAPDMLLPDIAACTTCR